MAKRFLLLYLPLLAVALLWRPVHAADAAAQIEESLLNSGSAASTFASLPVLSGNDVNLASEQFLIVQYGAANQAIINAAANGGRSMIYQAGYGNQATIIQH